VHELGHFLTAKWFGVRVYRFALGMGRPIVKWQGGETEYSLRWIPLGGFVDLAGEHPSSEDGGDPRGLCNKPAWQRVVVFSAGVAMNAVLAVVLFMVAPLVGLRVESAEVGGLEAGLPAAQAGLQVGDRIVAIDGNPVTAFRDIPFALVLKDAGEAFNLTVERPVEGAAPKRIEFPNVRSHEAQDGNPPVFGILPATTTTLAAIEKGSLEDQAGLKVDDRVVAVNGQAVERWYAMTQLLEAAPAGPVTLKIERDGKTQDLVVDPAKLKRFVWGMMPPTLIPEVIKNTPAAGAGVEAEDRVARIVVEPVAGARDKDGKAARGSDLSWPTGDDLVEATQAGGADATVRLTLWRKGKYVDVTCKAQVAKDDPTPRIGVRIGLAAAGPVQIGHVEPDGAAARTDLQPGDIVEAAGKDGKAPGSWDDLLALFLEAKEPVPLKVRRGEAELAVTYQPDTEAPERFVMNQSEGVPVLITLPRFTDPITAAKNGLNRAYRSMLLSYRSIRLLATRKVNLDNAAGPLGIVTISVKLAEHGLGRLIDFWGILSVCVAVMNFLPIPPFDGGHVLFVLIDKIKGRPVSLRVRHAIWLVGWVAVGLLFLALTYQDILRLIRGFTL